MDEKFLTGVLLGMLGGAVIVTNSVKLRSLVKEGQSTVKEKVASVANGKKNKSK